MLSRVQGVLKPLFILFLGGRDGGVRERQAAIHILHKNIFRVLLNICPHAEKLAHSYYRALERI